MYKRLKYLQIGLGSMGKRRIRNLLHHGVSGSNIMGFDVSSKRNNEVSETYKIQTTNNFSKAVRIFHPDVLIISTPPHLHMQYCLYAVKHALHFFCEISTTAKGYKKLIEEFKKTSIVAAPSCTYRFFRPIKTMKVLVEGGAVGKIQGFVHHMGQYLPDWHPWEDYRNFYVSKPQSSALKEMFPYELSWISWVLGTEFKKITGFTGKFSDLDMSVHDVYAAVVTSEAGVIGTTFMDVIARKACRALRVLGSEGTIEWELLKNEILLYDANTKKQKRITFPKGKKRKEYSITTEEMYENEIKAFLDSLDGKFNFPYTFEEDAKYIKLCSLLEKSNAYR